MREKSSRRRDAFASTRDARATRNSVRRALFADAEKFRAIVFDAGGAFDGRKLKDARHSLVLNKLPC